jgi:peptide deformylase
MIRPILKMGDARLWRASAPVAEFGTEQLQALLADMQDTMRAVNGAGLAAPQIGVPLRVVIFGSGEANPRYPDAPPVPRTVLVNPRWTALDDEIVEDWEGCLSVPGLRGVVPRFRRVRYGGMDVEGRPIEREVADFHARVVQHECDHLDGVLYPMRIRDFSRFGFIDQLFPELSAEQAAVAR